VSGAVAVRPLRRVPELAVGPAPALGSAEADRIESERRRIAAHPAMVDGPVLMVVSADPERIAVYPATYAWHTADRTEPLAGTHGALGVQLALVGADGLLLWQRRSNAVDHPGGWTISVAGTAVPGAALDAQIVAEAAEELGVREGDLRHLRPMALVDDRRGRTVQVVFRAGLSPSARIAPHPAEVAETRFAPVYPGDGPQELITAAWWPELVRLATHDG
jgi:isopentenyldiphosphate isomerase